MIGKITKGGGFKGCVSYILGKGQVKLLNCSGVLSESSESIIKSFATQRLLNPDIKNPVGHISLNYSVEDTPKLTDQKMIELAHEYMKEMQITDTQYIIARHHDREHPHVHIIFNRIDNNGKVISDKNDRYRNEQICKRLKLKHGLYFAKGKENVKQNRLKEPDRTKYQIYNAIKNGLKRSANWMQLQGYLSEHGIQIRFKYKGQTDVVQGISFAKSNYCFKGSEIDRDFSFSKLNTQLSPDSQREEKKYLSFKPGIVKPQPSKGGTGLGGLFDFSKSAQIHDDNEQMKLNEQIKKKKRKLTR